jgi:hypothetical protein
VRPQVDTSKAGGIAVGSNEKYEATFRVPPPVSAALRVHLAKMVQALQTSAGITASEACDHLKLQLGIIQDHYLTREKIREGLDREARRNGGGRAKS